MLSRHIIPDGLPCQTTILLNNSVFNQRSMILPETADAESGIQTRARVILDKIHTVPHMLGS